ncbi:hypothetical protein BGZ70_001170 [Mortierella alpina]|uniref:rRNA-processing protein EFG1 n=1 Tax=Mortierella alpina TaxID=64518 RepID=A0A9P6JBY9_MORAP|nr:hypothetical protein BGZ70_001170 [Mortierella alpina]
MEAQEEAKKKWAWKVAPSKAPGRVLKKKLRDMERLIQKKDTLKDIPAEVIQETEKKIVEIKKQIEALGPPTAPSAKKQNKKQNKKVTEEEKSPKALKFTELRRAGRKIAAFKKQHPNYENSEEESKTLADLELDLLYIKNFPRDEEYISIYPESPLTDENQLKTQAEIRGKIEKALANGEIKKTTESSDDRIPTADSTTSTKKHPASNWNDEESGDEDQEESENDKESPAKKSKLN